MFRKLFFNLALKFIAAFCRLFPNPVFLIHYISIIAGLFSMLPSIGKWRDIIEFKKHIGYRSSSFFFLFRYFQEVAYKYIFSFMVFEVPEKMNRYLQFDELKKAFDNKQNKGGILLGSHYDPPLAVKLCFEKLWLRQPAIYTEIEYSSVKDNDA